MADNRMVAGQQQQSVNTRLSYRLALARPSSCPPEIYDLMLECWQLNEHVRPSFRDITQFLTICKNNNKVCEQSLYWSALDTAGHLDHLFVFDKQIRIGHRQPFMNTVIDRLARNPLFPGPSRVYLLWMSLGKHCSLNQLAAISKAAAAPTQLDLLSGIRFQVGYRRHRLGG